MVAVGAGVVELTPQIGGHRLVRVALRAGAELDAPLLQGGLGAAADAAADQHVDPLLVQEFCQGAVAAAVGADDLRSEDPAVFHLIDLKGLGMAEVLEDLAVFVGHCDFHVCSPLL